MVLSLAVFSYLILSKFMHVASGPSVSAVFLFLTEYFPVWPGSLSLKHTNTSTSSNESLIILSF